MTEIQLSQREQDLQILSEAIPAWQQAKLEPFVTSPQQDVTMPTWNKVQFDPRDLGLDDNSQLQAATITVTGCLNGAPASASVYSTGGLVPL